MRNKELAQKFMNSIVEELDMYSDNLSPSSLEYVHKLRKMYKEWEKDLSANLKHSDEQDDNPNTEVDNDLYDMIDEYNGYLHYHEEYERDGEKVKLEMAM